MHVLRHLLSILALPTTVVVVVPFWILSSFRDIDTRWPATGSARWIAPMTGVIAFAAGLALFSWCVALFARIGKGTLAPWDPTQRLVAVGPYRHVRNPMIAGVATMLAGEALISGSRLVAAWLLAFVIINHAYFLLSEEPGLVRRFGARYEEYRAAVPRWIPRVTPWHNGNGSTGCSSP